MREARLIASARGFLLEGITVPVHVFQGSLDQHVPPSTGRHLAQKLPRGTLHLHEGEGHLSIVWNCFDECLRCMAADHA
jgi:pimeloyl-ACP methyl ester carboxylesterase